jgi:hypothetical protein
MSQRKDVSSALTAGITIPFLDTGAGAQIGLQSSYSFHPYFSADGMVSYNHTRIFSSFLSGERGHTNTLMVLMGGRIYLLPAERNTQYYFQLMAGSQYHQERLKERNTAAEWQPAYSVGFFRERKRFIIGITTQSPLHLALLSGFKF